VDFSSSFPEYFPKAHPSIKGPTNASIFNGWFKFLHVPIGFLQEHWNEGFPDDLAGIC
jgi:hypothetical protein